MRGEGAERGAAAGDVGGIPLESRRPGGPEPMGARLLRVALAGAGWVSEHHLDAYAQLGDRVRVAAIADPDLSAARGRAERYGIPDVFPSASAMLAEVEVDALDVAAPREFHAPLCRLAAGHGLAVLCQKPLAPTLEEARALTRDLEGRARLMVHENWRFRPHYRRIRAWIEEGRVGEVRTVLFSALTSGFVPDGDGCLPALVRQPMMAGLERMLLMEVMIHHVDALRFLLGPLELVGARLGKDCDALRGEDRAALFLSTERGAPVSLVGDFMAHGHTPAQVDRLEILGTRGAIRLEGSELCSLGAVEETISLDLQANYKASYREAIAHFLDRLRDGAPFDTGPEDNLRTLELVEAAYAVGFKKR